MIQHSRKVKEISQMWVDGDPRMTAVLGSPRKSLVRLQKG